MRRTISRLLAVAILSASAYAQVPVVGSTGQFGSVYVNSVPGLPLAQQGLYLGWNKAGVGETDFYTHPGTGTGGFYWFNTVNATQLMSLSSSGVLTVATVVANTQGTHTGNVTGNITGNGAGTWTGPVVGNASTATNVPYSGLTGGVPTWNQNTTGNSATSTLAAAATALAATPGGCASGRYAGGVNASGAAQNCSPFWLMATGTGCTTAVTGASSCTATVNWASPGFSGAPSTFMCGGISPTGFPQGPYVNAVTGSTISVQISNGQSGEAVASGFATVTCWGQQ